MTVIKREPGGPIHTVASQAAPERNALASSPRTAEEKPADVFEPAPVRPVVERLAPGGASMSRRELSLLEREAGRRLTLSELAQTAPNARLDGKGATFQELTKTQVFTVTGPRTLAEATFDKNGDVDLSPLMREDLAVHNQNLLLRKGDEYPVPLGHSLKNGQLVVRDALLVAKLEAGGFKPKDDSVRVDLRSEERVRKALVAVGFDPDDAAARTTALREQGVSVPLSAPDQLRRILVGKLDSRTTELDLDDAVVKALGKNNAGVKPTVYASAKMSPERLGDVILFYKRFNNQSFAGQGSWAAKLFNKDDSVQHEFDGEAVVVHLNAKTGEREAVLAARHYYAERYDAKELLELAERTGDKDLTTAVSYKAHGARLAEPKAKDTWAGYGANGVNGEPLDYIFKDAFPGLEDARPGGNAVLIPKEKLDLVLESDDQQTLNLVTQFGATWKGLFGTPVGDMYNDGNRLDRFGGTDWYYEQARNANE